MEELKACRLTQKVDVHRYVLSDTAKCDICNACDPAKRRWPDCCGTCSLSIAINRLAAYENTGLTPEKIVEWNRRAAPENKPLTLDELQGMDGEPVWIAWDDIGWEKVVLIDGYPRIAAVVNHGSGYQCHLYTPYDIDGTSHAYAHKPEGST